jgi:hypothetical protein
MQTAAGGACSFRGVDTSKCLELDPFRNTLLATPPPSDPLQPHLSFSGYSVHGRVPASVSGRPAEVP